MLLWIIVYVLSIHLIIIIIFCITSYSWTAIFELWLEDFHKLYEKGFKLRFRFRLQFISIIKFIYDFSESANKFVYNET